MPNYRTSRRPLRMGQWEAFDLLPLPVRVALREGPQVWCCVSTLRKHRQNVKTYGEAVGTARTVADVELWHRVEIKEAKPWQRPFKRWQPSPHIAASATMQRAS